MKKLLFISLIFSMLQASALAGGYEIKVKVKGVSDADIFLAYHYGSKKYVNDTIHVDKSGYGVFRGDEALPGGIYMVVMPDFRYFEILLSDDQKFSLQTDTTDFMANMKFSGTVENRVFYEYQKYIGSKRLKNNELAEKLKNNPTDSVQLTKQMKATDKQVVDYQNKLLKRYSNTWLAAIIKSTIRPQVPDIELGSTQEQDSLEQLASYLFMKNHFFDNMNLSDERFIRSPILDGKLHEFFDYVVVPMPDSIIVEADKLLARVDTSSENFKFIAGYLLNYQFSSKRMGMDKVFVHIAENYYLNRKKLWNDSAMMAKIEKQLIKTKPNLIGQLAPEMNLETPAGEMVSLRELKAKYTVIVFWDYECGHCKKSVPALYEIYTRFKDKGVEVFAVYTQTKREDWTEFINEHKLDDWLNVYDRFQLSHFRTYYDIYSTPVIYILDEKKNIIFKRIAVEQVEEILNHLMEKNQN